MCQLRTADDRDEIFVALIWARDAEEFDRTLRRHLVLIRCTLVKITPIQAASQTGLSAQSHAIMKQIGLSHPVELIPHAAFYEGRGNYASSRAFSGLGPRDGRRDADTGDYLPTPVRHALTQTTDGIFAVLDGAAAPNLRMWLEATGLDHRSLFQGNRDEDLEEASPILVRIDGHDKVTRALFSDRGTPMPLWDTNAGVLLTSPLGIDDLRAHLRRLTMLRDADGKWLYFRFAAPSTLHGLRRLFLGAPQTAAAFAGTAIRSVLYQTPLRNQIHQITFHGLGPSRPPVADERFQTAAAAYAPLRQIDTLRRSIVQILQKEEPELHARLLAAGKARQFGIAKDLWRAKIRNPEHGAAITAIIVHTGLDVLREPAFNFATKNPFLSGTSKARQLIVAFNMITKLKET